MKTKTDKYRTISAVCGAESPPNEYQIVVVSKIGGRHYRAVAPAIWHNSTALWDRLDIVSMILGLGHATYPANPECHKTIEITITDHKGTRKIMLNPTQERTP